MDRDANKASSVKAKANTATKSLNKKKMKCFKFSTLRLIPNIGKFQ